MVTLTGLAQPGGGGAYQVDPFVLRMSYDPTQLSSIYGLSEADAIAHGNIGLGYLDPSSNQWVFSTAHTYGGTSTFMGLGAYNPATDTAVGDYGVDPSTHTVWAVENMSGQFAVCPRAVPILLLGTGVVSLLGYGWRRRK